MNEDSSELAEWILSARLAPTAAVGLFASYFGASEQLIFFVLILFAADFTFGTAIALKTGAWEPCKFKRA